MNCIKEAGWRSGAVDHSGVYTGSTGVLSAHEDPFEGGLLRSQLERVSPQRILFTIGDGDMLSFLGRRALK